MKKITPVYMHLIVDTLGYVHTYRDVRLGGLGGDWGGVW